MTSLAIWLQNYSPILVLISILFLAILIFWNSHLQKKISRLEKNQTILFSGEKAIDLEKILLSQATEIKSLDKDIQELYRISNQINILAFRSLHKVGLVRFNPFRDIGGDQSFSLAILDGKNNGLTLTALFTREGTRIYAKSILAGKSDKHPLTEEEEKAVTEAMRF